MKIEKPVTKNMGELCNKFFVYMLNKADFVTKSELMEAFNIKNERKVRDIISTLAKKKPIIATSDNKGYKLARLNANDIELMIHSWKEIDSRITELEARKQPYIKLYEKAKKEGII